MPDDRTLYGLTKKELVAKVKTAEAMYRSLGQEATQIAAARDEAENVIEAAMSWFGEADWREFEESGQFPVSAQSSTSGGER